MDPPQRRLQRGRRTLLTLILLSLSCAMAAATTSRAFPPANIPEDCNSVERCCMPTPYTGKPGIYQFEYPSAEHQPMRIRRAAHLVDTTYVQKLEKAYAILRALPDSDPRSLKNQMNLHCLYCDNALYFKGEQYALEIHNGWFFLPWHRMFIYFHERILAKVLDDPEFALPYWDWDNQLDTQPAGNVIPAMYADTASSLYDPIRNNCSAPPFVVDLDTATGCTAKTPDYLRVQNNRLMYSQIVLGAPTTALFYGMPYRKGDFGGAGAGTIEDQPHGTVHAWVGKADAQPPRAPLDDMGNFGRSANDPLFYAHHTNVDRIWDLWTKLPGGKRTHPTDPDFLDSQFTFYDENGDLVKVNVSQVLDLKKLRYKNEEAPTPWITNGLKKGSENKVPHCNPLTKSETRALISNTSSSASNGITLGASPITFKVKRPRRRYKGTEVLELAGMHIPDITVQVHWKAYVFFPQAAIGAGTVCPEFLGTFTFAPHVGQSTFNPKRVWRAALRPVLKALEKDFVKEVVVTLVQTGIPQTLTFEKAHVIYDLSPEVTL